MIFKFYQCIFIISLLSPFEKGQDPSFEQPWNYLPQVSFVPSLVEIGPVYLEKNNFKFRHCIFVITLYLPLGNWQGPSFEQTWISFTKGCSVQSVVEIGPVVLEKKLNMWKVYRRHTDDRQQAIRKAHLSFHLRWAKNYIYPLKRFNIQKEKEIWMRNTSNVNISDNFWIGQLF